uniref:Uncharacterized protein n=1 Tax=Eubacterium cellulosolvens (strain ATCC 43171 / JCM 9499 / 6) TaxID=633697 RepID=I5ATZ5_EUBC6
MAHCMNCGNEIPEGTKFCPECGAKVPVKESTLMGANTYAEGQNQQNQDLTQGFFEQNISNPNSMSQANQAFEPVKTGSGIKRYAKFFGIGLFVVALLSFGVHMPFISIVLSGLIIGVAVFCLRRKYQLKGFTIAALVLSSLCLLSGMGNAGKYGLFQNHNYGTAREADAAETEVKKTTQKTKQINQVKETGNVEKVVTKKPTEIVKPTETPVVSEENAAQNIADTETEQTTEQTSGVDPELKECLDSYEKFVDEYVDFMKTYNEDSSNAITMMGQYSDLMQRYVDFSDKIEKYDESNLSAEDYKYYIEVTTRCSQKMLEVA